MKNGARYMRPDSRDPRKLVETRFNYCLTPFCHRIIDRKKNRSPYCPHCKFVKWKAQNPLRYSFGNLRRRAKRRGKDFSLTFEQYREFAVKTDYARLKGKSSLSLSIDRKNNSRGYHADNIQAMTIRDNCRKQFVPIFARQMENAAHKPTDEELSAVAAKMSD